VSGKSAGSTGVELYFARASGLLSRLVYSINRLFWPYYTQIDYSDFRDAAGLRMLYHWKISRVGADVSDFQVMDERSSRESRFAKPNGAGK